MNKKKDYIIVIISGLVIGISAVLLTYFGNPQNMGFCIACFERDIAGALSLHNAEVVQYIRPEIIGIVIGAFLVALFTKEFKAKGGSSPFTRFLLGNIVMVGALVFLGCPLRMVIRIGGGDLNAVVGLVGFILGILVGIFFIKKGFSFERAYKQKTVEGTAFPVAVVVLFVLFLAFPWIFKASEKGPASMHAPVILSLVVGIFVGVLAQRSRLCFVGGVRDAVMFKDFKLLFGFLGVLVAVLIGNAILGTLNFSFVGQPVAHTDGLWNFLSMALVGWGCVLLGGCPLRQLVLAGEGNSDSALTVVGMVTGAAFSHNFKLASSAEGVTKRGSIAVIFGFVIVLLISIFYTVRRKKND
ncbi:MAG: YedE-related selenium metabolism membrane protein [Oscillospiraceae bacterium]|nr:YedE-related selenium metabolism membrane protein [Candidatus Ruminococcus equi]